ncbi:hypothetical protein Bca101_059608 [Brassica carinata]
MIKWNTKVAARDNRKPSSDRSRFRGDEIDSRHRRAKHEFSRNSFKGGRYRPSGFRGVSRERSPKDCFQYQERSKGRTYVATRSVQPSESSDSKREVALPRDGQVILASFKDSGTSQVCLKDDNIENGLDVVNDDILNQENLGNADDMETDGDNIKTDEVMETNGVEDEFQELTDEESNGNQVVLNGHNDAGLEEKCEEGEIEKEENVVEIQKEENVVEVEKNRGTRKKLFKSVPLIEGTTKKRMVQALVSPRKRLPNKTNSKQGDGIKQGEQSRVHQTLNLQLINFEGFMDQKEEEERAHIMFYLWNKVGVFGSWVSGLRWLWPTIVLEFQVDGYLSGNGGILSICFPIICIRL